MRILHTMFRVGDMPRAIAFYTKLLGMQLLPIVLKPDQKYRLAFLGSAANPEHAEIELSHNDGVSSYEHGQAFGHVAIGWTM